MRLWSIHPKYLDRIGIIALWREALLAKNVLEGRTKGYKNHPQLQRFKKFPHAINQYLSEIYHESEMRHYQFNKYKINWNFQKISINVTKGQIEYEFQHLLKKLSIRYPVKYLILKQIQSIETFKIFNITIGKVENWEIMRNND